MLVSISGPAFVAGAVLEDGIVVKAAPILRYTLGWDLEHLLNVVGARGWDLEFV